MLKDHRCGQCNRLLARVGEFTELQIKCSRCGTLSYVRAESPERSPSSEPGPFIKGHPIPGD